jgi:hypothetical protein
VVGVSKWTENWIGTENRTNPNQILDPRFGSRLFNIANFGSRFGSVQNRGYRFRNRRTDRSVINVLPCWLWASYIHFIYILLSSVLIFTFRIPFSLYWTCTFTFHMLCTIQLVLVYKYVAFNVFAYYFISSSRICN